VHNLDYVSPCSGYYVKINPGVGNVTLSLNGPLFDPTCEIPLLDGWNLVGFPLTEIYYDTSSPPSIDVPDGTTWVKVSEPLTEQVFSSISSKYSIITGLDGTYDPDLPPIANSLHYLVPGHAYWIKMDGDWDLKYQ
jgi:hypothetical protein